MLRFLTSLDAGRLEFLAADWPTLASEHQYAGAAGDWRLWLALGGRGAGKTRLGAEWVRAQALGEPPFADAPARRIALVGPTQQQARAVMVEGVSGLLAVHGDAERPAFEPSLRRLVWASGTVAEIFSAEEPDALRGPQFDAAWCDELAKWRYPEETWDMLQFGLRLGTRPRQVVTTTPRPMALLKRLIADAGTLLTRATTLEHRAFLAPSFVEDVTARYGGTRLGRQELDAEVIEDDPDALFRRGLFETHRVRTAPEMRRIVVAVDPPATRSERSSACGIVCVGVGRDGRAYVLDDATVRGLSPGGWAARAVGLFHARAADRLIAEVNQGGDMVEAVIREVDPTVAFRAVRAGRGKRLRAEPVAALYEQGRVAHVGVFPELEDELCALGSEGGPSPDRADALVWAVSELMLHRRTGEPKLRMV